MVAALVRPHPLSPTGQFNCEFPEGASCAELALLAFPNASVHRHVVVFIGDRRIPIEAWRYVRPKAGSMVRLGLTCFEGGSGGNKQLLSMVAMIAIMIFAPYAAGPAGMALEGAAYSAAVAGITMIGALAVQALFKPPGLDVGGISTDPATASTYTITGQANQMTPYGPMLRVYGRHRIFPRLAAVPFTATEGNNQFLYLLLDCGYGPLRIEELQIGDTPLLIYRDVLYRIHPRWKAGDALEYYRNDTAYELFQLTLLPGVPEVRTSAPDASGLVFDFVLPRGLITYGERGEHNIRRVLFSIELRAAGSADPWTPCRAFPIYVSRPNNLSVDIGQVLVIEEEEDSGPELAIDSRATYPIGTNTLIIQYAFDQRATIGFPPEVGNTLYFASQSFHTITSVTLIPSSPSLATITFDPPLATETIGNAIQCPILVANSEIAVQDATSVLQLLSITIDVPQGQWEARVARTSSLPTTDRQFDELVWTTLRSIHDRPPVAVQADHTLIELKIRASEQLSGALDNVNCIATSILPVWDGVAWTELPTRNPAWAFVDVLTGSASTRPLPLSRLNLARLLTWANYCNAQVPNGVDGLPEPRVRFDHVVDYGTTVLQLLQSIAAAGRATPAIEDGLHGVIVDEEQTVPVQMFTPHNSWGFNARRQYLMEPDALRVKFIDPANNWQEGQIELYAEGKTAGNAATFEDLKLFGVTRYTQATRDARYMKAQALLRREEFEIQCDIENLICSRGDLVVVAHDVLQVGGPSSRVAAVAGATITIADPFGALAPGSYGVRLRLSDGTITAPIAAVPIAPDQFTLAVVPAPAPAVGDLLSWGVLSQETGDYLVKQVAPGTDFTAVLTLAEVARGVYTAESGEIPAYKPPSGGRPDEGRGPAVVNLHMEQVNRTIGREPYCDLVLAWDAPPLGGYPNYRVGLVRENGVTVAIAETSSTRAQVASGLALLDPDVLENAREYVVIGLDAIGKQSAAATLLFAPSDPHLVPGDCTFLSSNVHDKTTTLTWLAPPLDPTKPGNAQIMFYEVRWSALGAPVLWGSASRVTDLVPWNITTVTLPSRNGAYLVKALTASRVESVLHAVTVTAVEDLVIQDFWRSHHFEPEWAGSFDKVEVDGSGRLVLIANPDGTFPRTGVYYAADRETFLETLQCRVSSQLVADGFNNTEFMVDWVPLAVAVPLASARRGVDWDASVWINAATDPFVMADWVPLASAAPLDPTPALDAASWRRILHGEVIASDLRFAVVLEALHANVSPRVSAAGVNIDFPERGEEYSDIVVPAAGLDFVFARPFVFAPAVALDLQDAAAGDFIDRGPVDQYGFTVNIRNGGAAKAGLIDISAFGVGRVL